ncbi:MAG TPA: hypothetical protein VN843_22825, partial [Anaerolineales bacterium]|nr:hypothetical protein [Anaerolineales bacterium]
GYCYIDDIIAGSPAYQIPASTLIPPHGFWTLDRITYFNNTGDDVRFLKEDASTVLDSFTLGYTGSNLSWYRLPDGSSWAASPTASITKGQTNTLPFYPIVLSSVLADENPTAEDTINFIVTFSKAVTGVNSSDFTLTISGMTSPSSISAVNGSGTTYTVTVNTGSGDGSIRLNVVDDDSIKDGSNHPLGGTGAGNGNFVSGETYTIDKPPDNAEVFIGGVPKGSYYVGSEETISDRYGINGGPILVSSIDNLPIFTSQRAIYLSSFNSIVGYPGDQLTTDYWFTSYDDKGMSTFLVIGNPDPALTAEVDVYIAGNKMNTSGPIQIAPGQRVFPRYGINAGPVHVVSTNGVNIFTSERTKFKNSFN